ncbi:hypothetical protein GINT2_000952 [Glugoides intestinalis]
MQNTNDELQSKKHFQQHLTKYGTDYSKLTCITTEKIQQLYEDYIASKAQFVRKLGEESKIVEVTRIFKEEGKFRAVAFLDGRAKIQTVVDIRENDYRLPFLLKDFEFRIKEQLSHIQGLYKVMHEIGAIEERFIGDEEVHDCPNVIEVNSPKEKIEFNQVPVNQVPVNQVPVNQVPVNQVPVNQVPVNQVPVNQVPVNQVPVNQVPVNQVPVNQVPVNQVPVNQVPVNQVPVNQVPYDTVKKVRQDDADLLGDCVGASLDTAILSQYKDYITEVLPEIQNDSKEDGFQGEESIPLDLNSSKRRNATRIQLNNIISKVEENETPPPIHEKVGSVAHYLSKSRF